MTDKLGAAMDEIKKAELRAMLSMLKILCPQAKTLEQIEAEAAECNADVRSFCAGYFSGARDGIHLLQSYGRQTGGQRRSPREEQKDITNLWGLIP